LIVLFEPYSVSSCFLCYLWRCLEVFLVWTAFYFRFNLFDDYHTCGCDKYQYSYYLCIFIDFSVFATVILWSLFWGIWSVLYLRRSVFSFRWFWFVYVLFNKVFIFHVIYIGSILFGKHTFMNNVFWIVLCYLLFYCNYFTVLSVFRCFI